MKKLICLCVVLALAGTAGAATSLWKGGTGDWGVASNWISQGPPSATGTTYAFSSAAGTNVITVSANSTNLTLITGRGVAGAPTNVTVSGPQDNTLIVNSGVSLRTTKLTYMYSTQSGSKSTLEIQGTYDGEAAASTGMNFQLASGIGAVSTDVVKVYGTFNVAMTATSGSLLIATVGSGNGTVNIYSSGTANVRAYTIDGGTGTGHIYLDNGGKMWVVGNVTAQVSADITAGRIAAMPGGSATGVTYGYDATKVLGGATGATWVEGVPEPATVALLGLGSLLLYRKKR